MPFELPPLPYAKDALAPHISAQTIDFHYGKHHQAYVANLNKLVENTELSQATLEGIILETAEDTSRSSIFNNAAQVWNHTFFWKSMAPKGTGEPSKALVDKIGSAFGSIEGFNEQFKQAGVSQFGSGWVWLVLDGDALKILKTPNAVTPITMGVKPLLTCDVWEHAYYLDYQNRRPDFLQTFLDHLINWSFIEANLNA